MNFKVNTSCISCNSNNLTDLLHLGMLPIADALLKAPEEKEFCAPCTLAYCSTCHLLQIKEIVPPKLLFCNNYPYYSSVITALKKHFTESAETIISERQLNKDNFVLEIASNDGIMLETFKNHGIKVLGIDPAEGPANIAIEKGIETIVDFFGIQTAEYIAQKYGKADVILGNNVLAHTPYLNDFLTGIKKVLSQKGIAVIEVPYAREMLEKKEFDTIFHQHISYFSVTSVKYAIESNGLFLNAVKPISIHGGSLRLFISLENNPDPSVSKMLEEENVAGINTVEYLSKFETRIKDLKTELNNLLSAIKGDNKTIAGYGAAGKANTLLTFFSIGSNYLLAIGDKNKVKQGMFFTGNKLPVISPEELIDKNPDYILILAWNFSQEIIAELKEKGFKGKFIIPIPKPQVIS
jgi:SAM-dependent methyltransferase